MESAWVQDATLHLLQWETKGENENLALVLKTNGKKKKSLILKETFGIMNQFLSNERY